VGLFQVMLVDYWE